MEFHETQDPHNEPKVPTKKRVPLRWIIAAVGLASVVISAILMDRNFLPYANWWQNSFLMQYVAYVFNLFALITSIAVVYSHIGQFTLEEYVRSSLTSAVLLHFFLSVRDIFTIMDYTYPQSFLIGCRGAFVRNIPFTVIAFALSVCFGILLRKAENRLSER